MISEFVINYKIILNERTSDNYNAEVAGTSIGDYQFSEKKTSNWV
jgi:hypothetical protein